MFKPNVINDVYVHVFCFSCVFPEPSLTPENLSNVLDIMEDGLWEEFSHYVNIPNSEREKIKTQYSSDRECKKAVIDSFISTHPAPSWILLAYALYRMGLKDDDGSCHRALDQLHQLFPTGTSYVCNVLCKRWCLF